MRAKVRTGVNRQRLTATCVVLIAAWALSGPADAQRAELYRYVNDDGVVVISSNIPPRYASRGYTVIDSRGRVVREVPRQLTADEVRIRQQQEAEREAQRRADEQRRAQDEELLRLYGGPDEVAQARDRRIESIRTNIAQLTAARDRLESQKRQLEAEAAELERAGRRVPEHMLTSLTRVNTQIEDRTEEIRVREEEIERTRENFDRDRDRVARLLGVPVEAGDEG